MGTWFTWCHEYSEVEAQSDVEKWEALRLPLDVWGLDMNWRNVTDQQDRYYDHPATQLLPSLAGAKTGWFDCSSIGIPTIHRYRRFSSSST